MSTVNIPLLVVHWMWHLLTYMNFLHTGTKHSHFSWIHYSRITPEVTFPESLLYPYFLTIKLHWVLSINKTLYTDIRNTVDSLRRKEFIVINSSLKEFKKFFRKKWRKGLPAKLSGELPKPWHRTWSRELLPLPWFADPINCSRGHWLYYKPPVP